MRDFIFVDVETTGLDPEVDETVELTYARSDSVPRTLYFGVLDVPPSIDKLIKFTERGIAGKYSSESEFSLFRETLRDNTMVAANPSFDESFLKKEGLWTAHYRKLDVESYAMKAFELKSVPSMGDIYDILTENDYQLTQPDHTSYNDVLALRKAFEILYYQF